MQVRVSTELSLMIILIATHVVEEELVVAGHFEGVEETKVERRSALIRT